MMSKKKEDRTYGCLKKMCCINLRGFILKITENYGKLHSFLEEFLYFESESGFKIEILLKKF